MRIAILGTGRVAQTLAAGLVRAGHDVVFGSRDPGNRSGLPAPVPPRRMPSSALTSCSTRCRASTRSPCSRRSALTTSRASCSGTSPTPRTPTSPWRSRTTASAAASRKRSRASRSSRRPTTSPPSWSPTRARCPRRRRCSSPATTRRQGGRLQPAHRPRLAADSLFDLGGIANAYGQEHYLALFGTILQKLGTPYFNIAIVKAA